MKTTIKTFITAILAIGFGSFANAQSASISANATVISEIAVTSVSNLNFGTIVANQKKFVPNLMGYSTTVSTGTVIDNGNRGEFTVAAQAGADVTISLVLPISLAGGSGSLPIIFGETVDFGGDPYIMSSIAVIYQSVEDGHNFNLNSPSERFTNFPTYDIGGGVNGVRVLIGGTVDATNATAGTYTGTITLNATYN